MNHTHPAKDALVALGKKYPEMGKIVDLVAFDQRPAHVPAEYLLPRHVWTGVYAYLNAMGPEEVKGAGSSLRHEIDELRFLGTWAKTQGIYRFDPDIMEEVLKSPLEGDIPASLLRKLPEWCIYIETPGIELIRGRPCRGAWVMNDFVEEGEETQHELSILFDPELPEGARAEMRNLGMVTQFSVPLGAWPLEKVIEQYRGASFKLLDDPVLRKMGVRSDVFEVHALLEDLSKIARQILLLALFIATQADIENRHGLHPSKPAPQRGKRGMRVYGPSAVREWNVGVRMGAELRRAKAHLSSSDASRPDGGTVRPHLRMPHWHSFRVGPMKDRDGDHIPAEKRELVLRFIPSIPVNFSAETTREGLPAVVHPVRGEPGRAARQVQPDVSPGPG